MTPNNLRSRLYSLRDDWQNEIPPNIVRSTDIDRNYKARKAWFQGIMNCIWYFQEMGEIGKVRLSTCLRCDFALFSETMNTDFANRLTTPADIRKGDKIITRMLKEIEHILEPETTSKIESENVCL